MKRFWSVVINFWFVVISTGAVLVLCELVFQKVIFSKLEQAQFLREPGAYADIYSDKNSPIFTEEYWLLYYLFDKEYKPPDKPHPLFGWIGRFNPVTLIHDDAKNVQGRRPVLLFGDSFSMCLDAECFEDILNADTVFNKEYYLLNYGVGGYGVDQIYLLAREVIPLYDNPIVLFGLMTRDMDRNILKFRTGQKPYFKIDNNELVLHREIEAHPEYFVERNMPDITSYIYRYFRNSIQNYIPAEDPKTIETVEEIKRLNSKILEASLAFLQSDSTHYRYLVFSALHNGDREWRNLEVRKFLEENKVPYLWVKDLVEKDSNYYSEETSFYENAVNGHPTTYQNNLVCKAIKNLLFDSLYIAQIDSINSAYFSDIKDEFDESDPFHLELIIRRDEKWMESIKEKASERNISIDSMVKLDAEWLKVVEQKAIENEISIDSQIRLEAEFMLMQNLNKEN